VQFTGQFSVCGKYVAAIMVAGIVVWRVEKHPASGMLTTKTIKQIFDVFWLIIIVIFANLVMGDLAFSANYPHILDQLRQLALGN
jgi:hypothetical protein